MYEPAKPSSKVSYKVHDEFVDFVLLPAIKSVCPSSLSLRFGQSAAHYKELCRDKNGKYKFVGVYVDHDYLAALSEAMEHIVNSSNNDALSKFAGFFFLSHGVGLKVPVTGLNDIYHKFRFDFDFHLVDDNKIFVDIGMVQRKIIPGSVPTITLWTIDDGIVDPNTLKKEKVIQQYHNLEIMYFALGLKSILFILVRNLKMHDFILGTNIFRNNVSFTFVPLFSRQNHITI
jgi:hypothetical protein